ncbi:MAG: bifunctional methylenetetrahydrofolate dehydrogenase/methenyltetrahydrofolate cyclohydrolase [Gammaproteobacteria bacterium]|jgi:methylenetetrahydrofolate dehydrogenase (NADP+) / methenyltetrahydrofolate cyclohydrolase|nr:bifunctional methylenetetrahydrofolate dehydrogenase/methenyltetrahydrofolate cyclohydrolase [Gammaproteobacteria bacterium]MBT4462180.1 bifunctional methylenetetrahydrofolate dehydrogenase/methenyltetrahydrofolate cyclohydrolase [Gammaproteobacteria bacterium]MBT4654426.1 bifunctional methylenetetrahydrofolate dehydrogenase/methenyltetrahydrofolate cyclohydrolase [Gammaproteobacteria bacterium]MBT5116429.1 bifunctional methylenetetrahydrofolate dehydrogenase/methenyltetrahydrofolate cyclohyd
MVAKVISGREVAENILSTDLKNKVLELNKNNIKPKLIVILVGEMKASASYVAQKEKFAVKAGIQSDVLRFEATVTEEEVLNQIDKINLDKNIHGVIVQLPLPDHIAVAKVLNRIDPSKDVDGFTPTNVGKLFLGEDTLVSCTPKGIMQMLASTGTDLSGKNVTVVGRSNIVGKPVAILCLQQNATVTMCHSRTKDLNAKLADADVIIVAVGIPKFINGDQIPENCIVIDVGIHNIDGKLCGDVDFESASQKASAITPVPGGVGPMTVCALIENTIIAAERIG